MYKIRNWYIQENIGFASMKVNITETCVCGLVKWEDNWVLVKKVDKFKIMILWIPVMKRNRGISEKTLGEIIKKNLVRNGFAKH